MEPADDGGGEHVDAHHLDSDAGIHPIKPEETLAPATVDDSDSPFPDTIGEGTTRMEDEGDDAATEAVDDSEPPLVTMAVESDQAAGYEEVVVPDLPFLSGGTTEGEGDQVAVTEVVDDSEPPLMDATGGETTEVKSEGAPETDASAKGDDREDVKNKEDTLEHARDHHPPHVKEDECREKEPVLETGNTMIVDDADLLADMRIQMDVEEGEEQIVATARTGGGKRKRGRPPKLQAGLRSQVGRSPGKKKEEEDVCFICFDGGQLVLCDYRGCPKAYHPACVNRDESFFRSRGRWNCGWHICSVCVKKPAHFMCYTCTTSLCKACIEGAVGFTCVRENKGFCQTCLSTVIMIENSMQENNTEHSIDFDDKSNWMYMFKEYWLNLKGKLSLSLDELDSARTSRKGSYVSSRIDESSDELYEDKNDQGASSDSSLGGHKGKHSSRKKLRKRLRKNVTEDVAAKEVDNEVTSAPENIQWASKELLDLVAHMKNGDKSVLTQFDVQALLLEYIKQNNLRDPRRKSQIICDSMLQSLFGKERVAHFEMLKLLESHFLIKENSQLVTDDNSQGGVVDPDSSPVDADGNSDASTKMSSDKTRKTRKRLEERELQFNLDDYAAIDAHNINLMYLRRNLMEGLIDYEADVFHEKVIGAFVRIRISGSGQKPDSYRLVQVTGTGRQIEKYKFGKKKTDISLEIRNLKKTENITIDTISNQDFTEEECKRLRQSIKCGLFSRLTVGDVQEKARRLRYNRVVDWLENEKSRLGHLRDRASEQGLRKQHRECVEKIALLGTSEERMRLLNEVPVIHIDPNMDPAYESAEDEVEADNRKGDIFDKQMVSTSFKKASELPSPTKGVSVPSSGWSGQRKIFLSSHRDSSGNLLSDGAFDRGQSLHLPKGIPEFSQVNATGSDVGVWNANQPGPLPTQSSGIPPDNISSVVHAGNVASPNLSETEKIWHYQDPSGKVQGPFSMSQLRKWNMTRLFPPQLRIWKASEKQDDSILLNDALSENKQRGSSEIQQNMFCQPTKTTELIGSRQGVSVGNWQGPSQGSSIPISTDNRENGGPWSHYQNNATVQHSHCGATGAINSSQNWNAWGNVSTSTVAPQDHSNPRPSSSFLGNPHRPPPYQARGGHGGSSGRWQGSHDRRNMWNSNMPRVPQHGGQHYRRQSGWNSPGPQSSGGQWNAHPANAPSNSQWGSGCSNQHITTEQGSAGWTVVQGSSNQFAPTNFNQLHPTHSSWVNPSGGNLANQTLIAAHATSPTTPITYSFNGWGSNSTPISMPNTVGVGGTVNVQLPERLPVSGNPQVSCQQKLPESGPCHDMVTCDNRVPTFASNSSSENRHTLAVMQSVGSDCPSPTPKSEMQTGNVLCSDHSASAANSDVPSSTSEGAKLQVNATISSEGANKHNPLDQMGNSAIQCDSSKVTVHAPGSSLEQRMVHPSGSRPDSDAHVWSPISVPKQGLQGFGLPTESDVNISQQNQSKNTESSFQQHASENSGRQEVPIDIKMPSPAAAVKSSSGNGANVPSGSSAGVSAEPVVQSSTGWGVVSQNPNAVPISAQGDGNLGWRSTAVQGNMNVGWGAVMPSSVNVAWGIPATAQGNANVNLGFVAPAQASSSVDPSWVVASQEGNINPNMAWANAAQTNVNPNTNLAVSVQGAAMVNPGWGAAAPGATSMVMVDMNQTANWGTPIQPGQNTNAGGSVSAQGNANQTWDGNSNQWNTHHKQHGDGSYGQREGGHHRFERGRPAWNRNRSGSFGPSREEGVCWFHAANGYCVKGAYCKYIHR